MASCRKGCSESSMRTTSWDDRILTSRTAEKKLCYCKCQRSNLLSTVGYEVMHLAWKGEELHLSNLNFPFFKLNTHFQFLHFWKTWPNLQISFLLKLLNEVYQSSLHLFSSSNKFPHIMSVSNKFLRGCNMVHCLCQAPLTQLIAPPSLSYTLVEQDCLQFYSFVETFVHTVTIPRHLLFKCSIQQLCSSNLNSF